MSEGPRCRYLNPSDGLKTLFRLCDEDGGVYARFIIVTQTGIVGPLAPHAGLSHLAEAACLTEDKTNCRVLIFRRKICKLVLDIENIDHGMPHWNWYPALWYLGPPYTRYKRGQAKLVKKLLR